MVGSDRLGFKPAGPRYLPGRMRRSDAILAAIERRYAKPLGEKAYAGFEHSSMVIVQAARSPKRSPPPEP